MPHSPAPLLGSADTQGSCQKPLGCASSWHRWGMVQGAEQRCLPLKRRQPEYSPELAHCMRTLIFLHIAC